MDKDNIVLESPEEVELRHNAIRQYMEEIFAEENKKAKNQKKIEKKNAANPNASRRRGKYQKEEKEEQSASEEIKLLTFEEMFEDEDPYTQLQPNILLLQLFLTFMLNSNSIQNSARAVFLLKLFYTQSTENIRSDAFRYCHKNGLHISGFFRIKEGLGMPEDRDIYYTLLHLSTKCQIFTK